jgi:TetR/AcrR family transcriptional repressor of mexJK operon
MFTDVAAPQRPATTEPTTKQETILDAAIAVFLAEGYERASVDQIALEAGVSKRTIYNHFADKKALFLEVIELQRQRSQIDATLAGDLLNGERPLRGDLETFAKLLFEAFQQPAYLELKRLVIAEVKHHPELLDACKEGVPATIRGWLANRIAQLHDRGLLDVPNPRQAAENFMGLLAYLLQNRTTWGTSRLDGDAADAVAAELAEFFLRAYLPSRGCTQ